MNNRLEMAWQLIKLGRIILRQQIGCCYHICPDGKVIADKIFFFKPLNKDGNYYEGYKWIPTMHSSGLSGDWSKIWIRGDKPLSTAIVTKIHEHPNPFSLIYKGYRIWDYCIISL